MIKMKMLDKNVAAMIVAIACIPYGKVFQVDLGLAILNITDFLQLYLLFMALILMLTRGCNRTGLQLFFVTVAIFSMTISVSVAVYGIPLGHVAKQARFFLPFIVATAMLAIKIRVDGDRVLRWVAFATALSAFTAITLHLFFPAYLERLFVNDDNLTSSVLFGGRMYWESAGLSFFVIAAVLISSKNRLLLFSALLLVFFGILLTQSRTILAALLLFYAIGHSIILKKPLKATIYAAIVATILLLLFLAAADDRMRDLFYTRFFIGGDAADEYERSFLINRVVTYFQYWNSIASSFPFGQGLGKPLSVTLYGADIYTSDISFISFLLPFGILGLILFVFYLRIVWKYISAFGTAYPNNKLAPIFFVMVLTTMLLSLNLDIYSRNIFVIYLSFFASLLFQASKRIDEPVRPTWSAT
jgi:hypothetical protein